MYSRLCSPSIFSMQGFLLFVLCAAAHAGFRLPPECEVMCPFPPSPLLSPTSTPFCARSVVLRYPWRESKHDTTQQRATCHGSTETCLWQGLTCQDTSVMRYNGTCYCQVRLVEPPRVSMCACPLIHMLSVVYTWRFGFACSCLLVIFPWSWPRVLCPPVTMPCSRVKY